MPPRVCAFWRLLRHDAAHIAALRTALDALPEKLPQRQQSRPKRQSLWWKWTMPFCKLNAGQVIAVELDSPKDADLTAHLRVPAWLQAAGADLLTIADCPIARARMDSSLVACRVHRNWA